MRRRKRRRLYIFLIILAVSLVGSIVSGNNPNDQVRYTEVFVEANDTLWEIAQEHSGPGANILRYIEKIKDFNKMNNSILYANTILKVPEYK